jgi:formylglycine-generating enzyme required for sulfatase activity
MKIEYTPQELAELVARLGDQIIQHIETAPAAPSVSRATYTETISGVSFEMVAIEGGSFDMGIDNWAWTKPTHRVSVGGFYMGETPVTQELWEAVMGNNPSHFTDSGPQAPVERVSWEDVQNFLRKLNQLTDKNDRLPSEAEWEYAAGGGASNRTKWAGTDSEIALGDYAWCDDNSDNETHPVKEKLPNALGLYDMSGNVWDWCEDDRQGNYEDTPTDGSAWVESPRNSSRVIRGGSCYDSTGYARSAFRNYTGADIRYPDLGFRIAL